VEYGRQCTRVQDLQDPEKRIWRQYNGRRSDLLLTRLPDPSLWASRGFNQVVGQRRTTLMTHSVGQGNGWLLGGQTRRQY
jgi:hypothetical protein